MTNRVLCLVPFVAWFEDWMFIRKFKVLSFYWYIPVEVTGKCRCKGSSITINYWYNKNWYGNSCACTIIVVIGKCVGRRVSSMSTDALADASLGSDS